MWYFIKSGENWLLDTVYHLFTGRKSQQSHSPLRLLCILQCLLFKEFSTVIMTSLRQELYEILFVLCVLISGTRIFTSFSIERPNRRVRFKGCHKNVALFHCVISADNSLLLVPKNFHITPVINSQTTSTRNFVPQRIHFSIQIPYKLKSFMY